MNVSSESSSKIQNSSIVIKIDKKVPPEKGKEIEQIRKEHLPTKITLKQTNKTFSSEKEKNQQGFFGHVYNVGKKILVSGLNLATYAATYRFDPVKEDEKSNEVIQSLTGNPVISEEILQISPLLNDFVNKIIKDALSSSDIQLADVLKEFADNQSDLIQQCLTSTMLRATANLALNTKQKLDTEEKIDLDDIFNNLFEVIGRFAKELTDQTKSIEDPKDIEAKINELSEHFAQNLLEMIFPNQEQDIIAPLENLREYLYQLIEKEIKKQLPLYVHKFQMHILSLPAKDSPFPQFTENLDLFNQMLSKKIRTKIQSSLQEDAEAISKKLVEFLPDNNARHKENIEWLSKVVKNVTKNENPATENIWVFFEEIAWRVLSNMIVSMIKNTLGEEDLTENPAQIPAKLIAKIIDMSHENLSGIKLKIREANEIEDLGLRQKTLREILHPLSSQLLKATRNDNFDKLPIPEKFKEILLDHLSSKILPDMLLEYINNMMMWENAAEQNIEELKKYLPDTHAIELSAEVGKFVQKFIPYYMGDEKEKVAKKIDQVVNKYLKDQNSQQAEILINYLKANRQEFNELLKLNLEVLGDPANMAVQAIMPDIGNYVETAVLKILTSMSKQIQNAENSNPEFLVDFTIPVLNVVAEHFTNLHKVTKEGRKRLPSHLTKNRMLHLLDKNKALHPAVSADPTMSMLDKDLLRKDVFLKPLTQNILELFDLDNPEAWPFPSPLREEILSLIKSDIGPELLDELLKSLFNPHMIKKLLVTGLKELKEAENSDVLIYNKDASIEMDETQKKLNEALGNLMVASVNLVPGTLVKTVFKLPNVPANAAELIGKAMRQQLQKQTLSTLIDKGLVKAIDETIEKSEHGLPRTLLEKEKVGYNFAKEIKNTEDELVFEMKDRIKKEFTSAIKNVFAAPLKKFNDVANATIQKYSGDKGMAVKNFINRIFNFIFGKILGSILKITFLPITYPTKKIGGYFFERHLHSKILEVNNIIDVIGNDETFRNNLIETAVSKLLKKKRKLNKKNQRRKPTGAPERKETRPFTTANPEIIKPDATML